MPPNPPSNAHGFAMRSMSLRDMQIPKSEKKILGPPLPNPGDAPDIYRLFKTDICEEDIYDNRPSSRILNKARTNTLQLNDRNRHINKETHCIVCGDVNKREDIYHFLLHCEKYKAERQHLPDLQQPYIADENRIIGILLFDRANIEKKKETLYLMWKRRTSLMKTLN